MIKQTTACFSDNSFSIGLNCNFEHVTTKQHTESREDDVYIDTGSGIVNNSGKVGLFLFGRDLSNGHTH